MSCEKEKLNMIANEVQDLLIGEGNKMFTDYLDNNGYIYTDILHLGIYDIAKIIVSATENYILCPMYYGSIKKCLVYNLISKGFIQNK